MNRPAPFHAALAEGPPGGRAVWADAADGLRLRVGLWPAPEAARGTVFFLPGRAEYIEKYGRTATDLAARGYGTVTIDWRGQGLSPRALANPLVGHVGDFAEYQRDLAAMLALARSEDLPRPWFMLAHSMGACIGLRGLMGPHPFSAAVFSAPMWGMLISAWLRPLALGLSGAAHRLGFEYVRTPGTRPGAYVLTADFAGNMLTGDAGMWAYMRAQAEAHPELVIGGPSLGWLRAAMAECAALAALPSPGLPALTILGSAEAIVDVRPIHARMARWPGGRLELYPGAGHEVPMEDPATRARFADAVAAHFAEHREAPPHPL